MRRKSIRRVAGQWSGDRGVERAQGSHGALGFPIKSRLESDVSGVARHTGSNARCGVCMPTASGRARESEPSQNAAAATPCCARSFHATAAAKSRSTRMGLPARFLARPGMRGPWFRGMLIMIETRAIWNGKPGHVPKHAQRVLSRIHGTGQMHKDILLFTIRVHVACDGSVNRDIYGNMPRRATSEGGGYSKGAHIWKQLQCCWAFNWTDC